MRSGGGVLCIAAAQLIVGLVLLGIYEGYKSYYFSTYLGDLAAAQRGVSMNETTFPVSERVVSYESPLDSRSPMGVIWWLAILINIFSICGLAGVLNAHRELVIAFFAFNATQMVVSFHFWIDLVVESRISYAGQPMGLTGYEKSAAAFVFISFLLSVGATVFAMKAVDEIRSKQREDYNRLTVLSDTLAFEPDRP